MAKHRCTRCRGSGEVERPMMPVQRGGLGMPIHPMMKCPECRGSGYIKEQNIEEQNIQNININLNIEPQTNEDETDKEETWRYELFEDLESDIKDIEASTKRRFGIEKDVGIKYCSKCRQKITENMNYCPGCGNKI